MVLVDEILKLIKQPILDMGFTNVKVCYLKESGTNYLRVFIDKDDIVTLDDIVKVNDFVSPLLDKVDLIQNEYVLDVTSFGAEKPIDICHLDKYIGKYVNVHLSNPYKGENILEGYLTEVNDDNVIISFKEKTRSIDALIKKSDIDKARLAIKF